MWMWPLFFMLLAAAQEEATEKYCFSGEAENSRVQRELKSMLVPSDRLTPSGHCFILTVNSHRRELLQRFVLQSAPHAKIEFSSSALKREPCRLKVEKIATKNQSTGSININAFSGSANSREEKQTSKEIYQIQTLKDFELTHDQDTVKGKCRYITPERYEITLIVRKAPRPLLPGAPEGSIIVLNNPPPQQKTSYLQTTLQLQRGERIEVGGLVRNLREKSHEVDTKTQAEGAQNHNQEHEEIFLSLD